MTRGKYAAKAKNRLANLDNEILQEVIADRDSIKSERTSLAKEIEVLRRESNAVAMRKAQEIASSEIDRLTQALVESRKFHESETERIAFKVFGSVSPNVAADWLGIAEAFGMGSRFGELINASVPNPGARRNRRLKARRSRAIDSQTSQAAGNGSYGNHVAIGWDE